MTTDSSSDRDPFEHLAEEFVDRHRHGETAVVEDYVERHPEWADRIREVFPALLMLEDLKPGVADATGAINGTTPRSTGVTLDRLGDFRILREVGRGGMGVVYEAVQESLGRHVALKVLPLQGRIDPVQIERFRLEARSAARLHHTHIVPVHGVGEFDGVHYYAMQFIQGHGLDVILDDLRRLRGDDAPSRATEDRTSAEARASLTLAKSLLTGETTAPGPADNGTQSGDLPPAIAAPLSRSTEPTYYRTVARIGVQVAEALAHAHAQGVLHRDIKPSNLLLDADGAVWITDFGLAKLEGSDGPTRTGDIVGTLRYMAPERFEGWSDPRSDVYGLGITLYELLTLRPAFEAATRVALIERVVKDVPLSPRKRDGRIPRDLETIVLKAIAKEPSDRYATARALADDLESFLGGRPIRARRSSVAEQAWRWCRRNPTAAALSGVSVLAALALVAVAVGQHYSARLQTALRNEQAARLDEARLRYFHNMLAAEREWSASNIRRADQLLADCLPKPGGPDFRGWEWNYLRRQCHKELLSIPGEFINMMDVAFSPDGRTIASANGSGGLLETWDASTGERLLRIPVHDIAGTDRAGSLCGMAFSPDGRTIAVAAGEHFHSGEVTLWDRATGRHLKTLAGPCGFSATTAFSKDGRLLALASGETQGENGVTVWDLDTWTHSFYRMNAEGVLGVTFSPDSRSFAVALGTLDSFQFVRDPGIAELRDARTGSLIQSFRGHKEPLTSVAFSPDGKSLATGSGDRTIKVWDVATGAKRMTLTGHELRPTRVAFSPDGRHLASASEDTTVKIWDLTDGRFTATFLGHTREIFGLSYNADGTRLASIAQDQTLKVWDVQAAGESLTVARHAHWVEGVAFTPDGRQVVWGAVDGTVQVSDAASGEPRSTLSSAGRPIWGVAVSADGRLVAAACGDWRHPETEGEIRIWDARTGKTVQVLHGHPGLAWGLAFSPDGRYLATAGGESHRKGSVILWDWAERRKIRTLEGPGAGVASVCFSPDGRHVGGTSFYFPDTARESVWVWDAESGRVILAKAGHVDHVLGSAFGPDGRLATSSCDGTVQLWEIRTGRTVATLRGHKGFIQCVALSLDGRRIASAGYDGLVKIWDTATGQETLTLRGHTDSVSSVAFSPDGHFIASASRDGTVRIWDGRPLSSRSGHIPSPSPRGP
jgi:WD40 repeat protein/serine/threonine protein kinase